MTNEFIVLEANTFGAGNEHLALETSEFCAEDKHIGAGAECIENTHLNFNHTHYRLQAISKQSVCQDGCYSQVLISYKGQYHAVVVLTFVYATPTSQEVC